jgi:hypothetical protein
MGTQKFCRVSPQRFLFTDAFPKTPYLDTVIVKVHVLHHGMKDG